MIYKNLLAILNNSKPNCQLKIKLPGGDHVPEHFHITEVGHVTKRFIDCGGMTRSSDAIVLQAWIASDYQHRIDTAKLAKILTLAEWNLKLDNNLPVEIEYENETISQFPIVGSELTEAGLILITEAKHTDCLAKDKCGVEEGCCGPKGCC